MTTLTKVCTQCQIEKPIDQFYRVSTISTSKAVRHLSECKDCLVKRNKSSKRLDPHKSRCRGENVAINELRRRGIWAQTGKSVSGVDVDVIAWGCVRIEVKYSPLNFRANQHFYQFVTTPRQQENGLLADLVLLICETGADSWTFHLFDVSTPFFYKDGHLKSGWTYVPDQYRKTAPKNGEKKQSITDAIMEAARDRFDLIEAVRKTWQEREDKLIA